MAQFVVCSSHMKPSKIKGELPDVVYQYIADDSHIGHHYTITNQRDKAYEFDGSEINEAKFIAECWRMRLKEIN